MKTEKEEKILCVILLSVFLVVSGVFTICKAAFSSEEQIQTDMDSSYINTESDTIINSSRTGNDTSATESEKALIVRGENDNNVIPDKYNTGCSGDLEKISGETVINGIKLIESNGKLVFDFYYRNKNAEETILFENYDFSDLPVTVYHEKKVTDKEIKIVFKNCKFSGFSNGRPASDVFSYEFQNCSFRIFSGSNAAFYNCRFGGSYSDGMIPFSNITVEDCYFCDLASNDPKGNGLHSDGTQMYGYADAKVQNVLFKNCRFEIPAVHTTKSTAYVNSCIMLALEYNDGNNIKIQDCILNGGGYSIYATVDDGFTLTDASFENIRIGDAKLYGNIYYRVAENVIFTNVEDQDSLYVSSVWNDGTKTHVIVSNDTAKERVLRVVTGTTSEEFTIRACPGGDALKKDNYDMAFEDFPFDIDISVNSEADYVICFDVTEGNEKQIRYVSFDGNPTYYNVINETNPETNETIATETGTDESAEMTPIEGSCGKNITYYLDSSGILKIEGTGSMNNFNSGKPAPWMEYSDKIVSIELSEGIIQIGSQAFRNLKKVEYVELPESVTTINSNAFIGCSNLHYLAFYSGVTTIAKYAFHGTDLYECIYCGSEDEWNAIKIEDYNAPLIACNKTYLEDK